MKIARRLRNIYNNNLKHYELLSKEVNEILKPIAENRSWFFLSRIKSLESFALKVETGRNINLENPEDFFASTIVVPDISQLNVAQTVVTDLFDLVERRPRDSGITHNASSNFSFDDLRIYVSRRPSSSGRHPQLDGTEFEVQIKTVLQHAWSIATHDLIYKTDNVNWSLERIAYQVKAMLEHAEVAIIKANNLSSADAVAKVDKKTQSISKMIGHITNVWGDEHLPKDVKRLAETILRLLRTADLDENSFLAVINFEKKRIGIVPTNLSPYAFTVQALSNYPNIDFESKFKRNRVNTCLFVHDEMELPKWMHEPHSRIIDA